MKHNLKITLLLLSMFLVTQFIGIFVINHYSPVQVVDGQMFNVTGVDPLPYGLETPEIREEVDYSAFFYSIIFAFIIAMGLLFLLMRFNAAIIIKVWFFLVVALSLGIAFNAIFSGLQYASIVALIIALPLAFIKIFKNTFIIHNLTELFVYPGIAAVFVPLLNLKTMIFLLVIISLYDAWAVWKSGIMQKMAKYQIQELNVFSGFFIPHMTKKLKEKIKAAKNIPKSKQSKEKGKKFKINFAILGGGDVVFPILASGVMLKEYGFTTIAGISVPLASLFVIIGAALGLSYIFFYGRKKKFYPAMPYITAGIFLGMLVTKLLL